MQKAPTRTVLDEITDFLVTNPTPEEIIAYHLPDDLQARVDELVERNGEDQLSFDEKNELYDFVQVDQMMSLLKVKIRLKLNQAND